MSSPTLVDGGPGPGIVLRTLGIIDLRDAEGRAIQSVLVQPKRLALLAYLALSPPGHFHRRDLLLPVFWHDHDQQHARGALRKTVHFLRQSLGDGVLLNRGEEELGLASGAVWCDAVALGQELAAGQPAAALALFRGDLLPGFHIAEAPEFEQWLESTRQKVRRQAARSAWAVVSAEEAAGRLEAAVAGARQAVELAAHDEPGLRRMLTLLARAGDTAGATQAYEQYRARLAAEYGIDLSPETRRLIASIQSGARSSTGSPTPPVVPPPIGAGGLSHAQTAPHVLAVEAPAVETPAVESAAVATFPCSRPLRGRRRLWVLVASVLAVATMAVYSGSAHWTSSPTMLPSLSVGHIHDFSGLGLPPPGAGLAELLEARLYTVAGLRVISSPQLSELRRDTLSVGGSERIVQLARRAGATGLLEGALYQLPGSRLRLDLRWVDVESGLLSNAFVVEGDAANELVDRVVAELMARLDMASLPPPVTGSSDRLAVMPFAFRGEPQHGFLRDGLAVLLSASLHHASGLQTVDPQRVLELLGGDPKGAVTTSRARMHAEQLGAGQFVIGSILATGGTLWIEAFIHDTERAADPVARVAVHGTVGELDQLVDQLTAQLLGVRERHPGARLVHEALSTTASLPALKAYITGERELRAFHPVEAADAFRRAVELDSTFALAWYRLGTALSWLLMPEPAQQAAEQAVRHRQRLSAREQQLLEAFRAFVRGDAVRAEQMYRALLSRYPDDVEVHYQLSEVLFHYNWARGRSVMEARPELERTLALDPGFIPALMHLAQLASLEGRTDEADSLVSRLHALPLGSHAHLWLRTLRSAATGRFAADRELHRTLAEAPDYWLTLMAWNVAVYGRDPASAAAVAGYLTQMHRPERTRALGHTLRAYMEMARGRPTAARLELDAAGALDAVQTLPHRALLAAVPFGPRHRDELLRLRDQLSAWDASPVPDEQGARAAPWMHGPHSCEPVVRLYLIGLLSLRLGEPDKATAAARELERMTTAPAARPMAADLRRTLLAEIGRLAGDPARALAVLDVELGSDPCELRFASPFHSSPYGRYLRADLLFELGRYEESFRWYGSLAEHSLYDLVLLGPSLLQQAQIQQRLGDPRAAARTRARVRELWAGSEPRLWEGI